jgi:hypothetical protein
MKLPPPEMGRELHHDREKSLLSSFFFSLDFFLDRL